MSYLTLKNDRRRRRRAGWITFLITVTMLAAAGLFLGAGEELPTLFNQLFGGEPAEAPVAQVF